MANSLTDVFRILRGSDSRFRRDVRPLDRAQCNALRTAAFSGGLAMDRLDQDGDRLSRHRPLHRREIAEGREPEARREEAEAVAILVLGGKAESAHAELASSAPVLRNDL